MYLSTIAAGEFQVGQPISDLPLDRFVVLPFNLAHAVAAAELNFKRQQVHGGTTRDALKDDFKLLGQAKAGHLSFLITEDEATLYRYCQDLQIRREMTTHPIKLADGFDKSHFDPTRQQTFGAAFDRPPTETPEEMT